MRVENSKVNGDLKIDDEVTFNGSVGGSATIMPGGRVILNGKVGEDLILEKDSRVELFGRVSRNVYNRGGELVIHGTIDGAIYKSGIIIIHPEATLKGKIY